jgi:hypothetical protein
MLKKGENLGKKVKSVESAKTVKMVNNISFLGKKVFFQVNWTNFMQFECTYVPEISVITILHSATHKKKLRAKKKKKKNCFVNLKARTGLIENKIIRQYYRPIEGYSPLLVILLKSTRNLFILWYSKFQWLL